MKKWNSADICELTIDATSNTPSEKKGVDGEVYVNGQWYFTPGISEGSRQPGTIPDFRSSKSE